MKITNIKKDKNNNFSIKYGDENYIIGRTTQCIYLEVQNIIESISSNNFGSEAISITHNGDYELDHFNWIDNKSGEVTRVNKLEVQFNKSSDKKLYSVNTKKKPILKKTTLLNEDLSSNAYLTHSTIGTNLSGIFDNETMSFLFHLNEYYYSKLKHNITKYNYIQLVVSDVSFENELTAAFGKVIFKDMLKTDIFNQCLQLTSISFSKEKFTFDPEFEKSYYYTSMQNTEPKTDLQLEQLNKISSNIDRINSQFYMKVDRINKNIKFLLIFIILMFLVQYCFKFISMFW